MPSDYSSQAVRQFSGQRDPIGFGQSLRMKQSYLSYRLLYWSNQLKNRQLPAAVWYCLFTCAHAPCYIRGRNRISLIENSHPGPWNVHSEDLTVGTVLEGIHEIPSILFNEILRTVFGEIVPRLLLDLDVIMVIPIIGSLIGETLYGVFINIGRTREIRRLFGFPF